jgi:bifunctional DNA-binding transcriptional regulator/antitoxin component of YhaV-PrlF toxin-antitoxin module
MHSSQSVPLIPQEWVRWLTFPPYADTVGDMAESPHPIRSFNVSVDDKRRPTLPAALVREAGVEGVRELVARVDGPGRIVLEDPATLLAAFQAKVAQGRAGAGGGVSMADRLAADRAADRTFD